MAAQSDSALKLSLLAGLTGGIGSLALYKMISDDKKSSRSDGDYDDTTTVTSKVDLDYIDEEK